MSDTPEKQTAFDKVLAKAPWFVRVVFWTFWGGAVIFASVFVKGWDFREFTRHEMTAVASEVFEQKSAPLKAARDTQVVNIGDRISGLERRFDENMRILYRMEGKLDRELASK